MFKKTSTNLLGQKIRCKNYHSGKTSKGSNWQFCTYNLCKYIPSQKRFDYQPLKLVILNENLVSPDNPDNFILYISSIADITFEKNYFKKNNQIICNTTFVVYCYVKAKGLEISKKDLEKLEKLNKKRVVGKVDFTEPVESENELNFGNDDFDEDDFLVDNADLPF